MSNNNNDGRRYSQRLAREESSPLENTQLNNNIDNNSSTTVPSNPTSPSNLIDLSDPNDSHGVSYSPSTTTNNSTHASSRLIDHSTRINSLEHTIQQLTTQLQQNVISQHTITQTVASAVAAALANQASFPTNQPSKSQSTSSSIASVATAPSTNNAPVPSQPPAPSTLPSTTNTQTSLQIPTPPATSFPSQDPLTSSSVFHQSTIPTYRPHAPPPLSTYFPHAPPPISTNFPPTSGNLPSTTGLFSSAPLYSSQPPTSTFTNPSAIPGISTQGQAPSSYPFNASFVPPPSQSQSFPIPSIPPHQHSVKDLTIVLKSFPKKVTQDSYLHWKTQSLLSMSLHPIYKNITTRNKNGTVILNPNITHTDNVALYLATTTAFGDKATSYIDVSDNTAADGLLLWSRLDSKIMGEKTTFDTQDLIL